MQEKCVVESLQRYEEKFLKETLEKFLEDFLEDFLEESSFLEESLKKIL